MDSKIRKAQNKLKLQALVLVKTASYNTFINKNIIVLTVSFEFL